MPEFGKPKTRKFTVDEESLRELLNNPKRDIIQTETGPMIVPSAPFGGQPNIVGTELARLYKKFRSLAPNLDTRVSNIQYGPGRVATRDLLRSNIDPTRFGMTNLLGVTDPWKGDININPSLGSPAWLRHLSLTSTYGNSPPEEILGHELAHAAGHMDEDEPWRAGRLAWRIFGAKR
jgi:hypothetical protein